MRLIGLEPTRLATPDPKSGASTNFATSAVVDLFFVEIVNDNYLHYKFSAKVMLLGYMAKYFVAFFMFC